jgi:uncharacterized protein with beta-barrel porin domain
MGNDASVLAAEMARPADASDIDNLDTARAEIVRMRQLVVKLGGPEAGRMRAAGLGFKSMRGSVWSAARRSHGRRVAPAAVDASTLIDGGSSFGPDTSIDQPEDTSAITGQVMRGLKGFEHRSPFAD